MFRAIDELPVPVIGRVHGAAMGGGAGLAAVCDIVVAAEDAVFGFTEVKLGLIPAVMSSFVLPKIGRSAARELFLTGARFPAARAYEIGLVHAVVPAADLDATVARYLAELADGRPGGDRGGQGADRGRRRPRPGRGGGVHGRRHRRPADVRRKARKACRRSSTSGRRAGPDDQAGAHREPRRDRAAHRPRVPRARRRDRRGLLGRRHPGARMSRPPIGPCTSARRPRSRATCRSTRLIDAARRSGADAVHPGYGFLSQNPSFAAACEKAGIVFVGPPSSVLAQMGSKIAARRLMETAGVPVVPGRDAAGISRTSGIAAAVERVGLPALVKASAGGGGKGMRRVDAGGDIADGHSGGAPGSDGGVRRRHALRRAAHPAAAPRRGADLRRQPRQRRAPVRARVLGAAAASEGHRREPVARRQRAPARADDGGGRPRGARLPATATRGRSSSSSTRRRPRRRTLLLPRDEHAPAGRAPGDRTGDRRRSRAGAAARRVERAAAVDLVAASRSAATPSRRASTRKIRRAASCRRPGASCSTASRACRASASTPASKKAATCPCTTIRCSPRSSPRARRARRPSARLVCALREFPILGVHTNIEFLVRHPRAPAFSRGRRRHRLARRRGRGARRLRARAEVPAHVQAAIGAYESESPGEAQPARPDPWQSLREWRA